METIRYSLLLLFTAGSLILGSCKGPGRGSPSWSIVDSVAVEHLFSGGVFTEGPAVATDGMVYFSDLMFDDTSSGPKGRIWAFDPATGQCSVFLSPSYMSNGLLFHEKGSLIVAEGEGPGGGRITQIDLTSKKIDILAELFDGKPFNSPNDLCFARDGKILFTDPWYGEARDLPQRVSGVYEIAPGVGPRLLISDIPSPNGIALSPDGSTLYVGCYNEGAPSGRPSGGRTMAIYAYAIGADGSPTGRRTLVDYGERDGPDGLDVDADGYLFAAVRDGARPGIAVYDQQGRELRFITLPEVPSNLAFDPPPHANRIYVTAGGGLYRLTFLGTTNRSHKE